MKYLLAIFHVLVCMQLATCIVRNVPNPNFHNAYSELVAAINSDICFLPEANFVKSGFEEAYADALKCGKLTQDALATLCYQDVIRKFRYISNRLDHSLVDVACSKSSQADTVFDNTRTNIRQWARYPEEPLIAAIKDFASISLTAPPTSYTYNAQLTDTKPQPFDLMKTYMDMNFALTNNFEACSKNEMKLTQLALTLLHSNYVEKCGRNGSDSCVKDLVRNLQTGLDNISKQMMGYRCIDPVFTPIFNTLREGLKQSDADLLPNVRSYCTSPYWIDGPNAFNLAGIYKEIIELNNSPSAMRCFKDHIDRTRTYLEETHLTLQRCPSEPRTSNSYCFKNTLDGMQNYFNNMDLNVNSVRCSDTDFAGIRNKVRDGLKMPQDHLMNILRAYAITEIVDDRLDLVQLYKEVTAGVKSSNKGCFANYLSQTESALEGYHDDAAKCVEKKPNVDDACYQSVLDNIRNHFAETERSVRYERCIDTIYDPIRVKARVGLLRLDSGLRQEVKTFGETQIIDAVFDMTSTYRAISDAVKSKTGGCGVSYIQTTQKMFEDKHNDAEKCFDVAESLQPTCYAAVLKDIRAHFRQLDREFLMMRCFDPFFDPIRVRVRDALKLPEPMLLDDLRSFTKARLVDENLDLIKLYKDITFAIKNNVITGCMREFAEKAQAFLEGENKEGAVCWDIVRKTDDQKCFETRISKVRSYFSGLDNEIRMYRCTDVVLDPMLNRVREALKHTNRYLIEPMKKFADTQIVDAKFDLPRAYRIISEIANQGGCVQTPASRFKTGLEEVHAQLDQCPQIARLTLNDEGCYKRSLDQIKNHISGISNEIQMNRCNVPLWNDLKVDLQDGLKLPTSMLIDSVKVFANTKIIKGDFDLYKISKQLDVLREATMNTCLAPNMETAKINIQMWQTASKTCYANTSGDNCYKRILQQVRNYFNNEDQSAVYLRCRIPDYDDFRGEIRQLLQHRESYLLEAIRVFGGAPPTPKEVPAEITPPKPKEIPVQIAVPQEEPTGPADGCFKGEIDTLVKFQKDYRLQEKKCSEFNDKNEAQACSMSLYQNLVIYFTSPDRLRCFNTVYGLSITGPIADRLSTSTDTSLDVSKAQPAPGINSADVTTNPSKTKATGSIGAIFGDNSTNAVTNALASTNNNNITGASAVASSAKSSEDVQNANPSNGDVAVQPLIQSPPAPAQEPSLTASTTSAVNNAPTSTNINNNNNNNNSNISNAPAADSSSTTSDNIQNANPSNAAAQPLIQSPQTTVQETSSAPGTVASNSSANAVTDSPTSSNNNNTVASGHVVDNSTKSAENFQNATPSNGNAAAQPLIQSPSTPAQEPSLPATATSAVTDSSNNNSNSNISNAPAADSSSTTSDNIQNANPSNGNAAAQPLVQSPPTPFQEPSLSATANSDSPINNINSNISSATSSDNSTKSSNEAQTATPSNDNAAAQPLIQSPPASASESSSTADKQSAPDTNVNGNSSATTATDAPTSTNDNNIAGAPATDDSSKSSDEVQTAASSDDTAAAQPLSQSPSTSAQEPSSTTDKQSSPEAIVIAPTKSQDDNGKVPSAEKDKANLTEEDKKRTYAEVVKTRAKPNYFNIYKSIRDNVKNAGCAKAIMTKTMTKLEQTNLDAAKCRALTKKPSVACFNKEINGVKTNFSDVEAELKNMKCSDRFFTPTLANAQKLFQSGSTLSEMRSFAFYSLSDMRNEP